MSKNQENRSPDEIEADIQETRAQLDDTLHELEDRLSPKQFMDSAYNYVRNGGANEFLSNLGQTIRQNPLPVLLTGIGIGWLIMSQRKANQQPRTSHDDDQSYGTAGRYSRPGTVTTPTTSPVTANKPSTANNPIKGTQAVHTGTSTSSAATTEPQPDVVGEATHLGTHQGRKPGA